MGNPAEFGNSSIRVDVDIDNIFNNPYCEHGPTILFTRHSCNGSTTKYYACSACRNRKLCSFYLEEEKKISYKAESSTSKDLELFDLHHKKYKRCLKNIKKDLSFCNTCSVLIVNNKFKKHSTCSLVKSLSEKQIQFPSQILVPKSDSKCEAQYFFTSNSLDVILKSLEGLGTKKLLCIGAPRIHELVKSRKDPSIKSILLDIDTRFCNFFPPEEYIVYNIFNHYFFNGTQSKDIYVEFLKGSEKLVLVTDPPFGGRMELMANTFRTIEREWRDVNHLPEQQVLPVIMIFPYFLEKSIKAQLPSLSMLEYQVDYDNHALYTTGPKGLKQGSAVRMFTNVSPIEFPFPAEQGYSLCRPCGRWVHPRNVHCNKCGDCTSKDGRTYKHCDICKFCVKPAWLHCVPCGRCLPTDHNCKQDEKTSKWKKISDSKSKKRGLRTKLESKAKKRKKDQLPKTLKEEKNRDLLILQSMFKT